MFPLHEPLFQSSALKNLKLYRYSGVDKSPLTKYVLRHYWDFAASLFPLWMAPNLITLGGLGFILVNIVTVVAYLPDLVGPAPAWVYYSFALGLFLYQTFDNVDGRQARRTGSSSALGHIFDHTIDSLNCPLGGLIQVAALGLGHTRRGLFMIIIGLWPMWLSTWEEYYTGTLYLGYINGPTEGILIACAVHLISGFYGITIWETPVKDLVPFSWALHDIQIIDFFQGFVVFAVFIIHAPACVFNVYTACTQNSLSLRKALIQHTPFIVYNLIALSWVLSPHSALLSDHAGASYPSSSKGGLIEFALLMTFTFGKLGPRVILSRLSKSPFPWFNFGAFGPLLGGAVMINLPYFGIHALSYPAVELWYLRLAVTFALSDFVLWFVTLCRRFMVTLDIGCLSIKRRKD